MSRADSPATAAHGRRRVRSPTFLPQPAAWFWGHHARPALAVPVLLLALLALAAAVWQWSMQQSLLQAQQEARADTVRAAPAAAPAAPAIGPAQRQQVNRIVRRLNTPWAAIFEALEAGADPQVAIVSLESDAERGAVRVVTEGPALDALLAHAEKVQSSPRFARTQLLRIEPPDGNAPAGLSRLSFDLVLAR